MEIVFWIFIASATLQGLYYVLVFARLNFIRETNSLSDVLPPVSVVICAHNEAENLIKYLKVVLIQQYPIFEVILVNDRSTDNTIDVMVDFYKRNINVRIINIPPEEVSSYAGKKQALMKGIALAQYETIVVTDADCRPASTHWLAKLVGTYLNKTRIVLGYSPFEKRNGFLNKLIRYENLMTALQYFGFAKAGMPYMGVGRNLSYKKSVFTEFEGFETHCELPTGDDDLLVNAMAIAGSTEICMDKDTFMFTPAASTFREWLNSKRRHLRSGFRYKWHHRIILFLFALSSFLFYSTFVILLGGLSMLKYVLLVFLASLILKFISVFGVYKKLGAPDLIFLAPILDVAYTGYLLIVFFLLLLKPKNSWT